MKRKTNIRRHFRKTKHGPIVVRYHTRLYSQLPRLQQPTIEARERVAFDALSKAKHREYGGLIDFGKNNRIEAFTAQLGEKEYVDIPDYEVNWHTHPKTKRNLFAPSGEDIKNLSDSGAQKASMILQNGKSIILIQTPESKRIGKLSVKEIDQKLGDDYYNFGTKLGDQLNSIRKLGFKVIYDQKGDIKIPIKVVEPKRSYGNWTTVGQPLYPSTIKILEQNKKMLKQKKDQLSRIIGDLSKHSEAEQLRKDIKKIEGIS